MANLKELAFKNSTIRNGLVALDRNTGLVTKQLLKDESLLFGAIESIIDAPEHHFQNPNEAAERLEFAREWLQNDGTVLYYGILHTNSFDVPFDDQRIIQPHLLPKDCNYVWISSFKFNKDLYDQIACLESDGQISDTAYLGKLQESALKVLSKNRGFSNEFVVQRYIIDSNLRSDEAIYFAQNEVNQPVLQRLSQLAHDGNAIIGLYSTGTRDKTGQLARADRALLAFSRHENVLILPVTNNGLHQIQGRDQKGLDGLNFNISVSTRIGEPITAPEAMRRSRLIHWREQMIQEQQWDFKKGRFHPGDYLMLRETHFQRGHLQERVPGVDPAGIYRIENVEGDLELI